MRVDFKATVSSLKQTFIIYEVVINNIVSIRTEKKLNGSLQRTTHKAPLEVGGKRRQ